jgi:hypothetical protein
MDVSFSIGPIPLMPGEEKTVCSVFRLKTTTAIDVTRIDAELAPGSHHLIFYKSTATVEAPDPTPCGPLEVQNGQPVFIAETQMNNSMQVPTGAAFHFEAGQMIKLEAHYLNASQSAINGMGSVHLTAALPGAGPFQAADILFCGSVSPLTNFLGGTGVPPGAVDLPAGFWKPPAGIKVFGLTTHEHKRGSLMTVDKSTSAMPGTNLTQGMPYDNPPFKVWDDSSLVTFAANEGFQWQCHYNNTGSMTYYFGQSAEDNEMCFFWAYYYPSVGHFIDGDPTDNTNYVQGCWQ